MTTRPYPSSGTETSYQRVIAAAENAGLFVQELESGKRASIQTPGHSARDRGTSVTYTGELTLIHCFNGDTDDVLNHLGLEKRDLYDNPKGSSYDYGDGRMVFRSPDKKFTQRGNTKGTNLYGLDTLDRPGPVYVVEGEKDVTTAANVLGVAAVTQAQGASTIPAKADWAPLAGRDVIIVADKDNPGRKRADTVMAHLVTLEPRPETVQIVEAAEGKDLSDHVAAGRDVSELIPTGQKRARRRVRLVQAATVKTERVDWIIDQWIPKGMLTLLAGREGIGKSTIACSWVADLSRGGTKCAYLNSEDSRAHTVKPRLEAAGADLRNVYFIDVDTEDGGEGHLRLPADTHLLFDELSNNGVEFVVLDAAKSSMDPKLDGYKDDHVRQFLEPLAAGADKHGITIVGLSHFGKKEGKDTGKLLLGSIAWSQIARSVLSVAVDEENSQLIVSNTKFNLARDMVSREARIISKPLTLDDGTRTELGVIEWGDFTDTPATALLDRPVDDDHDDRTDAEAWLEDYLTVNGASPRADVLKAAAKDRIASERTIKRAFKNLRGVSEPSGFPRVSTWSLPAPSGDSGANTGPCAYTGGPTGPTGADQHKQNGPTGEKSQLGHANNTGPTGGPTGGPAVPNAPEQSPPPPIDSPIDSIDSRTRERAPMAPMESQEEEPASNPLLRLAAQDTPDPKAAGVLSTLGTDYGLSVRTIKGSLTRGQLDEIGDLDEYLGHLKGLGVVVVDNDGRYYRPKESA